MHFSRLNRLALKALTFFVTVNAHASVKSYREWKNDKIQTAQSKISTIRGQIEAKKLVRLTSSKTDPNLQNKQGVEAGINSDIQLEKLERQLKVESHALETAGDLTLTDYFVGYLIKAKDRRAAFSEVAGRLSAEEVAELMNAYANSVFGIQSADLPASASNLTRDAAK